ncbi:putative nitrogen metabolite repression- -responsible protein [Phaeoacremonium minimum UCRPA7]|uniref:Putative nitrogen metabolite repression--responsible protein n=1 Tax=Phaeoacremonium minimum (strain UCR-PA7) TaxID=1286976 RepID=R8BHA8_PHAM7|nr:putative nitrogen metabolite repression- -responsible protein [Phaeoacremonium minimum UCRPA7]EON98686.1 putative nitrogen metabolite repression- -responsible protein [Phaeoacremonium minimum UCRPA7]
MPTPNKTIAVINASGRQAASLIRVATAVGYHVRAQLRNLEGVVATEVSTNPNVTVLQGELYTRLAGRSAEKADVTREGPISGIGVNHQLISELFRGAQLAFINTTFYGDEIKIGEALADAAKRAGIQHYIYSSMPDHRAYDATWPSLPLWASKHKVEDYVKSIGLPATFVYTGIYNNNFTSLPYPLFCMELQPDGSFRWQAPFHPDAKLPWLDAEHDVGPAIIQIFKDGISKWKDQRIALAYEMLSPREACKLFETGVGRKVRYVRGEIELKVKIPEGYRIQLEALETLFNLGKDDPTKQPPYFGDKVLELSCPTEALELWEGPRGLEEYAREVFPLEEQANGLTWMLDEEEEEAAQTENDEQSNGAASTIVNGGPQDVEKGEEDDYDDDEEEDGLVMRGLKRDEEEWLA